MEIIVFKNIPDALLRSLDSNLKCLRISKQTLLKLIANDCVITNIPDGCYVKEINVDILCRGFYLILWHPSFEPIDENNAVEYTPFNAEIELVNNTNKNRKLTF
jgi:hypothetical protein